MKLYTFKQKAALLRLSPSDQYKRIIPTLYDIIPEFFLQTSEVNILSLKNQTEGAILWLIQ